MSTVRISNIRVGDRHRKDLGDIDALAASILEVGQLQPIVLDKDFNLIAGYRRLKACEQMGRSQIDAHCVVGLDDALRALRAERDENTCRKDFTPSELFAMGAAVEAIEAPKAADRQAASHLAGRDESGSPIFGGLQAKPTEGPPGRTDEIVSEALGVSRSKYQRIKTVTAAANDETAPESVREVAADMAEKMDSGEVTISAAAIAVGEVKRNLLGGNAKTAVADREDKVRALAARGYLAGQIAKEVGLTRGSVKNLARRIGVELTADALIGNAHRIDPNRVVEQTIANSGLESSLASLIDYSALDRSRLEGWISSLSDVIGSLTTLKNKLKKELTNDQH